MSHRIAEFYSGIGGMHYAWRQAGLPGEVVAAFDINTVANSVYHHNFPTVRPNQRLIESIPLRFYRALQADVFLMSPPCQPYTRVGLQKGSTDARAKSFLFILDLLRDLGTEAPRYILLENVVGFETSDTRELAVTRLTECGYAWKEFIINPKQLGIPNSRARYYLLAKRQPLGFVGHPPCGELGSNGQPLTTATQCVPSENAASCSTLGDYLGNSASDLALWTMYGLPGEVLSKRFEVLDVVTLTSRGSCCFTKAYTHYAKDSGSVLQWSPDGQPVEPNRDGRYRYFTEHEIARLMGFPTPSEFTFPTDITRNQRYRLLGNSLSINVLSFATVV
ncbi:hypothetical protein IWQ62_005251 [Dispira parvispora]|uniref:Uncharacterized protein n=1 Tax=Dispira parvispora TaxID=1520584 RepID=A0A9W8AJ68_9FUNG|nr:hypothetical protein IWQ62_005251 [Dispira parvispora]